jgi:eukaryotic-like serine/threonine-protein kinase
MTERFESTRLVHPPEYERALDRGAQERPELASAPAPTTIGRYRVTGELGRGGMGVVYRAHDPTLDRTVAIKLVRTARPDPEARDRLIREARVLARLSDPNVVEVFEIGEHEQQLFIAMELVRGVDLRCWRAAAPRSQDEILDVLMAAGRGLAAAHAAGLVHRDFKPDNVMVGDDGRVRVLDFGLARAAFAVPSTESGAAEPAPHEPAPGLGSGAFGMVTVAPEDRLTQTGVAMGTPAYMAPEQFRRAVDDPRVDQFAFGVLLFEMLAGRRPFEAASYEALAKVVARGELHEPREHPIARPLFRVLRRALAPAPDDRFPSMPALLAALEATRRPARGRWAMVGLAVVIVAVGVAALTRPPAEVPCPGPEQLYEELWGEASKLPVRDAILGTAVAYAEPTWQQVDAAVDGFARAWSDARHDVCQQLRAPVVDTHADQRLACLQDRRVALLAALDVLTRADGATVHNAHSTIARLPSIRACETAPFGGGAQGTAATPEHEEQERRLATARAHYHLGRYAVGLQELMPLVDALGPDAPPGVVAEVQLVRGQLETALGRALPGAEAFEAAYFAALESEQLDVACRAASLVAAEPAVSYRERWQWAAHAKAARERHGDDEELAGAYEHAMCVLQSDSGALDEAIAHCERALAIVERREPADPEATARALAELGTVVAVAEDRPRAYALRQRALELSERTLGPQHPMVANAANDLGFAALALGRHDEASALAERALVIRRATLGPEHPDVVLAEDLQVRLYLAQRRNAQAKALAQTGLARREQVYGDTHPLVAKSLYALALAQERLDENAAALLSIARVAEIEEQLHPLNIQRLPTLREQARMAFEIGAGPAAGREHLERAWAIVQESEIPAHHPLVRDLCHGYGETLLELGEAAAALPYLERFVANPTEERIRHHVEFVLARALVAAGKDRARAIGLVRAGIDAWEGSAEEFHRSQVADMRAWLASVSSGR